MSDNSYLFGIYLFPAFQILEEPVLFNQVRVDAGGYGVTWNDNLDLSCNELWEKGEIVQ